MSTEIERLPYLIQQAASALALATTAAEVLEVIDLADVAYTAAKTALRLTAARRAHDEVVAAARKAMGDALVIESRAQCRLANEYDRAQERGEIAKPGKPSGDSNSSTQEELELSHKTIHEARNVRDAEEREPGTVRKIVEEKLQAGETPTRADVKRAADAILNPPPPKPKPIDPPQLTSTKQSVPVTINTKRTPAYVHAEESHGSVRLSIRLKNHGISITLPYKETDDPTMSVYLHDFDEDGGSWAFVGARMFDDDAMEKEPTSAEEQLEVFREWIMAALGEGSE